MKLSEQRLDEILTQLEAGPNGTSVSHDEWLSMARELRSLRLRTSSASRTATAPKPVGSH